MSGNGKPDSPSTSDGEQRRMVNTLHSKTRSLPNETLSYVFQHACPTLDIFDKQSYSSPRFHLVLRLVSTLWYSVVQSTPQLWTTLYLFNITREEKKEYIKLCLDRSGQLGLHIIFRSSLHLTYPHPINPYPIDNEDWANEIMERNIHRIESLQVSSPSSEWFKKMIPKMSRLSAIKVYAAPGLPKGTSLKPMSLESAKLHEIYKEPPMTSVTYLDLNRIPIDCSIQFLIKCPNLVEFSSLENLPSETSGTTVLPSTLVLDRLSAFSWSTPYPHYSQLQDQLFERLHVPALQRFYLDNYGKLDLNASMFAFFSRLPKSMKEIDFRYMNYKVKKGLLRNVVNDAGINCIRVDLCSPLFLKDIFSTLSETTNEGTFRFPNLTCIQVGHPRQNFADPPLKLWIGQKLALMLQDRTGTIDKFTFAPHSSSLKEWNDEIWGLFKELKEDGLDLTIIDSGNVVDIEEQYEKSLKEWTSDLD